MVEACLDTGTHYLDITGELEVFTAPAERDDRAEAAGKDIWVKTVPPGYHTPATAFGPSFLDPIDGIVRPSEGTSNETKENG